jgi:hypothetical protein
MLWQSAPSEFFFMEAFGLDIREVDFLRVLRDDSHRQRRSNCLRFVGSSNVCKVRCIRAYVQEATALLRDAFMFVDGDQFPRTFEGTCGRVRACARLCGYRRRRTLPHDETQSTH